MDTIETTKENYKSVVIAPFSKFDTVDFIELNKHKVDEVKYFIFGDHKKRFALVGGIKGDTLKFPFSATFACFSEITHNNKITHYHEAVKSLIDWGSHNNIKKIILCTPPLFYNEAHITKLQNALICNGFKLLDYDVNFQLELTDSYNNLINSDARRNIKISENNNLSFEKTDNLSAVYAIIKQNRQEKGYPLWMSEIDVANTSEIIKSDYFLVSYEGNYIASAYIQRIKEKIAHVVYWGNLQKYDHFCPMNFLAKNVYEYYLNKKNIRYISIGTSTLDSIPNFGLCDFKEAIGCNCAPKLNFEFVY